MFIVLSQQKVKEREEKRVLSRLTDMVHPSGCRMCTYACYLCTCMCKCKLASNALHDGKKVYSSGLFFCWRRH